ncbi:MAG: hypothetical protein GC191_13590 [Azospirillum sp.]|nr:hypothetical protein [Azospirillum sp.]
MSKDPLDFTSGLELFHADAAKIKDDIAYTISDGNQFWFVLPDGVLPDPRKVDVSLPYLRFTAEGRRDCMLTRALFGRNSSVVTDQVTGEKLLLDFRPCVLVGRNLEGKAFTRTAESGAVPAEHEQSSAPPVEPPATDVEAEGTEIPDIGELLDGLQQTRKSLDTIDSLLAAPDALLVQDDDRRRELQETIAETKDQVLIGLGDLGELLSRKPEGDLEEWRMGVSKAVSATIEAMMTFEGVSAHLQEQKRHELEALRKSIESYFATIDPTVDGEACRKFSSGINKIILSDHKDTLTDRRVRLTAQIGKRYDSIVVALQDLMPKGVTLPLIPFPYLEPAQGYKARLVLNMVHVVIAVRYGSFSIKLDTSGFQRLFIEMKGGDTQRAPRVHIVDRRRYAAARRAINAVREGF